MVEKIFNANINKWEEKERIQEELVKPGKSVTDIKNYRPTLDSIRNIMATGKTKQNGMYDFDEDGNFIEENNHIFENFERPDISEVEKKLKQKQRLAKENLEKKKEKEEIKKTQEKLEKKEKEENEKVMQILEDIKKGVTK